MSFCKLFVPLHYETKQQNMDKKLKIIHLHEKETNKHHYFGSLSAVYHYFTSEQLGIAYTSLKSRGLKDSYYENRKVVIRQDFLKTKPQPNMKKSQKTKELNPKTTPNTTEQ